MNHHIYVAAIVSSKMDVIADSAKKSFNLALRILQLYISPQTTDNL